MADFRRFYGCSIRECRASGLPLLEVAAMAAHLPADSAVARAQDPDHLWTLPALLLATVVDELRVQTWLKTKDGARGRNRPKPIPRPGVQRDPGTKRLGNASMSLAEAKEWRKARRTGPA